MGEDQVRYSCMRVYLIRRSTISSDTPIAEYNYPTNEIVKKQLITYFRIGYEYWTFETSNDQQDVTVVSKKIEVTTAKRSNYMHKPTSIEYAHETALCGSDIVVSSSGGVPLIHTTTSVLCYQTLLLTRSTSYCANEFNNNATKIDLDISKCTK